MMNKIKKNKNFMKKIINKILISLNKMIKNKIMMKKIQMNKMKWKLNQIKKKNKINKKVKLMMKI